PASRRGLHPGFARGNDRAAYEQGRAHRLMKRATKPRAIVFDLDGTLLDSMGNVLHAIAHAIEPFERLSHDKIREKLGGPPERFMATLLSDPKHVPAALARLEQLARTTWRDARPFEG